MTLNDLSTIPPRPLTAPELESLDTSGWTRQRDDVEIAGRSWTVDRYPVSLNEGYWTDSSGQRWGNVTAQCRPLPFVQVIFWKMENGIKVTQPIEVEPLESELSKIQERAESLRKYHAEKVAA